jgi:putative ABC transport system permease protein
VAIVNKTAASKLFPGGNALGNAITMQGTRLTVVGVVSDMRFMSRKAPPEPQIYTPIDKEVESGLTVLVRTPNDPTAVASSLRALVHSIDPKQPVDQIVTMDKLLANAVQEPRTQTVLLGIFAALAFAMACLGIYGVVAYSVTQRTREIAVRVALGAERASVVQLVLGQGIVLAVLGALVGAAGSIWATKLVAASLYDVKPLDPIVFALTALLLLGVSAVASFIPARRATRIDPMMVLRGE